MAIGASAGGATPVRPGERAGGGLVVKAAGTAEMPQNTFITQRDAVVNWCRKYSLWPMPFATACCGIELMATGASRHDIARFGAEAMRFSPRQCDLMIVAGRVVMKMLPVLQRIWLQMPEPKWCISMGACASSGGVFDTYAVVQGIDRFIPVDVYVPGCPPRPEQLLQSLIDLQNFIKKTGTITGKEFWARTRPEGPRPVLQQPANAVVAPADFATATRWRDLN
jgi:NADH-quinone oxidoreductase subunit B